MKEKKWRIEVTEHQLRLMAQCIEDCHRFIGGQMELRFLAETYYLYREIYHRLTLEASKHKDMCWNVYLGETLTCDESGEPIKVERIE